MGREAKAAKAKRVKLDKVDFFELLATLRHHEVLRLEAQQKAARIVAQEIEASGQKGVALMAALGKKYGFDPAGGFGFDDATCELIPRNYD